MSEGPQYTNCIDKGDWKSAFDSIGVANIAGAVAALLAALAGFPLAGLVLAFAAGAEIMRKVAEWQLNGKLICLDNVLRRAFTDPDPDRICVLGTVLDFESVGEDKSGFENIDNDFGVNLFLAPFAISELGLTDFDFLRRRMESSPQGDLIQNPDAQPLIGNPEPGPGPLQRKDDPSQNFGPMPADPAPPGFIGYKRSIMLSPTFPKPIPTNAFFNPLSLAKVDPVFQSIYDAVQADFFLTHPGEDPTGPGFAAAFYGKVDATFHFISRDAPSFHCEFEGSRIRDVYDALDFAHVHCEASGFWGFVCDALNFLISTLLGLPKLIAAAAAWANADDGALSNSYDGAGGEIGVGDSLVLRGRWVYDSAHSGYNEMHAVRTVQKTGPAPQEFGEFIVFHGRWCSELAKVPPAPPRSRDPDAAPPDPDGGLPFTKPQQNTYDAQQRDENRWVFHPAIDGCTPQSPPDSDLLH